MNRFKTISTTFIVVIAMIFCCNVFYLVCLYNSIRKNLERDVKTAIADADLDELWIRAEYANGMPQTGFGVEQDEKQHARHGEISVGKEHPGNMVSTTRYSDGQTSTISKPLASEHSLTNQLIGEVGKQFHAVMDPYVKTDINVMDSVLRIRLNDRFIYPDEVYTEVVDSMGKTLVSDPGMKKGTYDRFSYCFNTDEKMSYRVSITPLTHHIISEMAGVIVTVFLLLVSFATAFIYLLRTVSRMRTVEEMKDDFVSNMTHELKTPVSIAYSAIDALLNYDTDCTPNNTGATGTSRQKRYLTIAGKQLKRLSELIENILAMSMERHKSMKSSPVEVRLYPFIAEIAEAHRMRSDKDIDISLNLDNSIVIKADTTHLANVMHNLIDNAIKYSGDRVTINISGNSEGMRIADNGIGIPARSVPYIFNKFYRVPQGNRLDVRGYGIGLYYVKSVLDRMGWSISVTSKEGKGSVFTIKFNNCNV